MTTLEKRESQAPVNSPEAQALASVRSILSNFFMTLPSLVIAMENANTRRASELMNRALRQYEQFQHAYNEFKENHPQIVEEPEFASFDRDYENAIFDGGGELKAMHAVDEPIQRVDSRLPGYEQAKSRIRFEKKYAEKIVSLFPQESASTIKRVETIRKDPRFASLMDQELAGKNPQDIQKMAEDLNKPEASQQIMQKVMHFAAPQAPAAPQGPAAPFCCSHLFLCRFLSDYCISYPVHVQ